MSPNRLFLIIISILVGLLGFFAGSEAQGKGGGGFSRFKQAIESVRISQREPVVSSQVSSTSFNLISQQEQIPLAKLEVVSRKEEQQTNQFASADAEPAFYGSVSGTAGVDFPALTRIPLTKFTCDGLPHVPGFYADEETGCQVFHLCYDARKESFLCGVGTIFNQATLNCDYWHSVECSKSSQHYNANLGLGKSATSSFISQQRIESGTKIASITRPAFSQQTIRTESKTLAEPVRPVSSFSRRVETSFSSNLEAPRPKGWSSQRIQSSIRVEGVKGFRAQSHHSPASVARSSLKQSSLSVSSADNSQQESMIVNVTMARGNSLAGFNMITVTPSSQDNEWRPIFKSKTSPGPIKETTQKTETQATTEDSNSNADTPLKYANEDPQFNQPVRTETTTSTQATTTETQTPKSTVSQTEASPDTATATTTASTTASTTAPTTASGTTTNASETTIETTTTTAATANTTLPPTTTEIPTAIERGKRRT